VVPRIHGPKRLDIVDDVDAYFATSPTTEQQALTRLERDRKEFLSGPKVQKRKSKRVLLKAEAPTPVRDYIPIPWPSKSPVILDSFLPSKVRTFKSRGSFSLPECDPFTTESREAAQQGDVQVI